MTILFKDDWKRFPNAIADYETKNKSFLRMVSLYHEMGVENCLFPISLLQPVLQGIDPHDPDLSDDYKLLIAMECKWNPWYFLREVVRIPPVAGPYPISYIANRGNIALTWLFLLSIDVALIQPRQTGKSVSTDCIIDWLIHIGTSNSLINMVTKDNELRVKNVERLKKIRDLLPKYLIQKSRQDSDNQINITYHALDNYYQTGVAQNSESAAGNLGRGLTSPVMHVDEGPYIRYIGTTIPAALAGGTAAKEEAKLNNRLHGNIFTTTAGKKDDRDGKYMYDLIFGGTPWNEKFLDCNNRDELIKLLKTNCTGRKLIVNCTFNHRQLGKTDEWLYNAISDSNANGDEANRDFFNIWTSGTQSSPLSIELNERIKTSELDPLYTEITKDSYVIRWYVTEDVLKEMIQTDHFILGLDTSDAIGRDSIALVFINIKDQSVVGAATINETSLIRFSQFLSNVLIRYTNTTLVIERKSSAQSIIDFLLISLPKAGVDPFVRIYNHIVDGYLDREREYKEIQTTGLSKRNHQFYEKYKKHFGFNTTGNSRDLLYSAILQTSAKNAGHLVKDRVLSNEIRGLIVKNGRIDHSNDSHDDMVISWLMANWFLIHSKNLDFYGIRNGIALSKVNSQGKTLSFEEEYELDKQKQYRQEIEEIYEKLTSCNQDYLISKYESRLRYLDKQVVEEESESNSIDSLIAKAEETRKRNFRNKALKQRQMQRNNNNPFNVWR